MAANPYPPEWGLRTSVTAWSRLTVRITGLKRWNRRKAAQILDIPIGTVMSRLHRGRRILKKTLAEESLR